jgi:hypothetical protein
MLAGMNRDELATQLFVAFGNDRGRLVCADYNGVWQAWRRVADFILDPAFTATRGMQREEMAVLLHKQYKSFHKHEIIQIPESPIWRGWLKVADFAIGMDAARPSQPAHAKPPFPDSKA